jgi:2-polyprenyl-6-methoxyphenol hydroxylase-like FAD-dependent oxidoreductase
MEKRSHALVIGGGIAGLLAARVLTDHFERVTLVEREQYPAEPVFRSGVPQGRHIHTTLLRGQRELEVLFPGLEQKLLVHGAVERDYGNESLYYYGGRCPQLPPVLHGWNCSRLLLEWQIRQELTKCSQLHMMEGYEVVDLLFDRERQAVKGVYFRARSHTLSEDSERECLAADLVIDASGSSSRAPQWLLGLGYEAPEEMVVDISLGYATRFYQPSSQPVWKGIAIGATPEQQRAGVLMAIEGGRWMVGLGGVGKDMPPTDAEGYLAFARSLPDPSLYEAIKEATPISPIYGYRRTENRLRHFDRLRRQPEGFLVMGDAVCAFNPIYGQGMTVAVLEALALDRCLRSRKGRGLASLFQRKVARVIAFPWMLATASDARISGSKGAGARGPVRWLRGYMENVFALLKSDQMVLLTFLEVIHLLRSPLAFMHPAIIAKVVVQGKR